MVHKAFHYNCTGTFFAIFVCLLIDAVMKCIYIHWCLHYICDLVKYCRPIP